MPQSDIPVTGIDILGQFQNMGTDDLSILKKLNAAFLIKLSGTDNPLFNEAGDFINSLTNNNKYANVISFFNKGEDLILDEVNSCYDNDKDFKSTLDGLYSWLEDKSVVKNYRAISRKIRNFFFPEGNIDLDNRNREIESLREKRTIRITGLNENHIRKPEEEILFTSNALITVPPESADIDELDIDRELKSELKKTVDEEQLYWYDHPIQIGTDPENNEVIYGLDKLDEALAFEEDRGIKDKAIKANCVLSVSVTHRGLQKLSKSYIEKELHKSSNIKRLNVFVFTEKDCKLLIDKVLNPAAEKYLNISEPLLLNEIFGVDGEYGRHYTFLKSISAFWNIFISPEIKGTFKIDLDQVFPQSLLKEKTGATAFEHLKSPLWGAAGKDSNNNDVHLGFIAGALVNEKDMGVNFFS